MLGIMRDGGYGMWALLAGGLALLWVSIQFVRNATPQRLSLIRALTLAQAFASIVVFVGNLVAVTHFVGEHPEELTPATLLQGFGESCAALIGGGTFLVIAWVLVAIGVSRMPHGRE